MTTIKIPLISFVLLISTTSTISARPGLPFHPCNTLIISTFSFSLPNPNNPRNPNPNPNPDRIIFTNLPLFPHHNPHFIDLPFPHPRPLHFTRSQLSDLPPFHIPRDQITDLPLGFTSIRDRTKDILSVVASLLFGAACGALTAGTMYLIWSLFNYRFDTYGTVDGFSSDDDESGDDDIFNPKKPHYVAIPAEAVSKETETV